MSELTEAELTAGGREVEVTLRGNPPVKQVVLVKEVPMFGTGYRRYALALANQNLEEELALYGINGKLMRQLQARDIKHLREVGREVNQDPFSMAIEDQNPAMAAAMKQLQETLSEIDDIKNDLAGSTSDSSAGESPGQTSSDPEGSASAGS